MSKKAVALIVAAGESRRMGGEIPKQYQMLGDKSLLRRSVEAFLRHPGISGVRVVINPAHQGFYDVQMQDVAVLPPVMGGATRQESVKNGLASFGDTPPDYVLVHDAARPNVSAEIITRVLDALAEQPAVIPALPVIDTLKHVEDQAIVGTIARTKLFRAQTPQGFHFRPLREAHQQASGTEYTDDAAVAENAGLAVSIVPGSEHNYKITTAEDMHDANALLEAGFETRTGMGVDAHRLVAHDETMPQPRRGVMLCGVLIPFEQTLSGHSDADVALHALVDAMLGAISEGDIGQHFPPSDPRWRGANSSRFVLHALQLVRQKKGRVVHVDITLVCERPHLSAHRDAMRASVAAMLELPVSRVSVKATTTEKMGFTGRGEGIAAYAVASVRLPAEG